MFFRWVSYFHFQWATFLSNFMKYSVQKEWIFFWFPFHQNRVEGQLCKGWCPRLFLPSHPRSPPSQFLKNFGGVADENWGCMGLLCRGMHVSHCMLCQHHPCHAGLSRGTAVHVWLQFVFFYAFNIFLMKKQAKGHSVCQFVRGHFLATNQKYVAHKVAHQKWK